MIEKVMLNVTLKAGKNVWEKGAYSAPIPQDILDEVYAHTDNVTVIDGDDRAQTKLVYVAKRVEKTASSMTTMAVPEPENKKPKPKLLRRR